ncbi:hypothetical protein ACOSP7_002054 [Xanthoceras sorbifolium]
MRSTFEMGSFVRDYISLKHIWDNIMMEKFGTISVPGELREIQSTGDLMDLLAEFEEKKVKQIHFNVDYMALNVIQLVPNPEQDPEPLNQTNQPTSQSNQPNQPPSQSNQLAFDPLYEGLINDSESSTNIEFNSDEEGGSESGPEMQQHENDEDGVDRQEENDEDKVDGLSDVNENRIAE